ncbi:MAG: endonuclease/exonuclease/phosphatase family protein [Asticcacaulis sp.]|uniref:endonuclease/exonuclease/phosphatase family protein n=1 Tax=Asticcacaulis sp. TaxID=1872648 RepID=UPI0039E4296F
MRPITVLRAIWSALCTGASALSLVLAALCYTNPHYPPLYLIDIFTLPLLTATVALVVAFWLMREKAAWRLGFVAAGAWLLALWPQAFPPQTPVDTKSPTVRVMFSNLYIFNRDPARLLDWVGSEKPDIVATVENLTDPDEAPMVDKAYPYHSKHRDTVVYSRYPILSAHHGDTEYSFDMFDIRTPQGLMHLAVVHLCQPRLTSHECQSSQMTRLRQDIGADERPDTLMVGDFNSSLSAYLLQDFARDMKFRPVAAPTGTWPALLPGALRIGIDNAFAGSHFSLSHRQVGPDNGSDHRPILIDVRRVN